MIDSAPRALIFADRRQTGRFPVRDDRGRLAAHISTTWTGTRFTARDADERPLCAAAPKRLTWLGLSGQWRATGPDGAPMLVVNGSSLRPRAQVLLHRGGVFIVRGSACRRDFTVTDAAGQTVLHAAPRTSALSLRQHDYVVEQTSPVFGLPELVALVQIWRMARKAEAAAAAGSTAALGGAYGGS